MKIMVEWDLNGQILSEIPWEAHNVPNIDRQCQINRENLGQYTDFENFICQTIKTLYVINGKIKRPFFP